MKLTVIAIRWSVLYSCRIDGFIADHGRNSSSRSSYAFASGSSGAAARRVALGLAAPAPDTLLPIDGPTAPRGSAPAPRGSTTAGDDDAPRGSAAAAAAAAGAAFLAGASSTFFLGSGFASSSFARDVTLKEIQTHTTNNECFQTDCGGGGGLETNYSMTRGCFLVSVNGSAPSRSSAA